MNDEKKDLDSEKGIKYILDALFKEFKETEEKEKLECMGVML